MWRTAVFLMFFAFLGQFILKRVNLLGFFRHVYHHQPGPCIAIPGIEDGSEDLQALPDGKILVTSGLGHLFDRDDPVFANTKGQIFMVDSKAKNPKAVPVAIQGGLNQETFRPHGLSLWKSKTGKQYVFVVNHRREDDAVEKFLYDEKEGVLKHLKSINVREMRVVNDLVAVGDDEFYYTNYHYYRTKGIMTKVELLALLAGAAWGSVGYVNAESSRLVAEGLPSPNGINVSPDGRYVYVAIVSTAAINVYKRSQESSLTFQHEIPLYSLADNLDVDPVNGDIYTGAHPIPYKVMPYLEDPTKHAPPSQVLRIKMKDGKATDIEELYAEEGLLIHGSTVAVYRNQRLFIGTVYHKLAMCDVKYLS